MAKKILFIDRDGTIVLEPNDYQLDSLDKLEFYPNVFQYLGKIAKEMDFELVLVTNQDGLGTNSFPENDFWPTQNFIINAFANEGIVFDEIFIDSSLPEENSPNRKPRTGMLTKYIHNSEYDSDKSERKSYNACCYLGFNTRLFWIYFSSQVWNLVWIV